MEKKPLGLSRPQQALAQYHMTEFVVEHLIDCHKAFDGDLQLMLIVAVIGQASLQRFVHAQEKGLEVFDRAITASRLADITGIPRQTVRRKLIVAQERGWLEQTDRGAWRIISRGERLPVQDALRDIYERGLRRGLKFAAAVKPLVE
jgi:response regulator of citrate/malate metabolism